MSATIVRARTFDQWFKANFSKEEMLDIASHGADAGWHHLTYTSDCAHIFDKFAEEIWEMACGDAEDQGMNVCEMIAGFARSDMAMGQFDSFKNLMLWYAAERTAQRLTDS